MGFGDGTLGALVSWAGIVVAINQVFSAAAFTSNWRFDRSRSVAFVVFFVLSYFLQSIAILIRGGSILAPLLLVISIPVSVIFGLFWSALFARDFFKNVRHRVAFMLGLTFLALSYWLTHYIAPKVGHWRSWFGISDQILFRSWSIFVTLFTIVQVFGIGSLVVSRVPAFKPKIDREKFLIPLGLGLGTVAMPFLIVVVNPTYPVMLLIYVSICYVVSCITLFLMLLYKPNLVIGSKIGLVFCYHSGLVLGFLLLILIGKGTVGC